VWARPGPSSYEPIRNRYADLHLVTSPAHCGHGRCLLALREKMWLDVTVLRYGDVASSPGIGLGIGSRDRHEPPPCRGGRLRDGARQLVRDHEECHGERISHLL